jgi:anti-anti-sigma factor
MSHDSSDLYRWSKVENVAVVQILPKELTGPEAARALGDQLDAFLKAGENRLLLDFRHTHYISSTVFGTLLSFWKKVEAAKGEVRICAMEPGVKFGADIIGLGRYIPIHDDEPSALAAFRRG